MFIKVVSGGFVSMIVAGILCGFNKYICIIGCAFIIACAIFGIVGMVTHNIGAMSLPAEAIPHH